MASMERVRTINDPGAEQKGRPVLTSDFHALSFLSEEGEGANFDPHNPDHHADTRTRTPLDILIEQEATPMAFVSQITSRPLEEARPAEPGAIEAHVQNLVARVEQESLQQEILEHGITPPPRRAVDRSESRQLRRHLKS